ncbi:MAG: recombinase family protein [Streptosporangiaceae bacterium]
MTLAWRRYAVRAILANPCYTGHQVWNRAAQGRGTARRGRRRARPHGQAPVERDR